MANELGLISATMDLNITPFLTNGKALETQIKREIKLMNQQEQMSKNLGTGINGLTQRQKTQQRILDGLNKRESQLLETYKEKKRVVEDAKKATADQQRALARAATELKTNSLAIQNNERNMAKLNAEITRTRVASETGLGRMSTLLATTGSKITGASEKLVTFGKAASSLSVPLGLVFGAVVKQAVEFKSQIAELGPLLSENGNITATIREQMDQMANSSKKWATSYGQSTTDINTAMSELTRRGFTASQVMGSMPSILDATRASGESMGDVMGVTASVIEMFGMKAKNTATQTQNTKHAVDSLTFIANKTATGFKEMGDALTYVGPIASQAGMSIEQTASAIGLMSNKGIDASIAGTSLRAALTRLMTPSDAIDKKMESLGINLTAFRKGTIGLPEVIDQIEKGTQGMTKVQKAGAIAAAFGKQAQGFSALLGKTGASDLRKYTEEAEKAAGSTAKIAKEMNNTPAAKIAKFKESLKVLAITMGEKLLPAITPFVDKLTDMMKGFSKLSPATQKFIGTMIGLGAIVGPVSLTFGKFLKPIGLLAKLLSKKGLDLAVSKFGGSLAKAGTAAATTTASTAGFAGGLKVLGTAAVGATGGVLPLVAGIAGVGLALGAGVFAWNKWGKAAVENRARTQAWGTTVSEAADKSLSSFKVLNDGVTDHMGNIGKTGKKAASEVTEAFSDMANTIEKNYSKSSNKIETLISQLPENLRKSAKEQYEARQIDGTAEISQAKQISENISNIYLQASKEKRGINDTERTYIINAQRKMQVLEVNSLNLSNAKKKKILSAFNQDLSKMSDAQIERATTSQNDYIKAQSKNYDKLMAPLKKAYDLNLIDSKQYYAAKQQYDDEYALSVGKSLEMQKEAWKRYAISQGQSAEYGEYLFEQNLKSMGISLDTANDAISRFEKFNKNSTSLIGSYWDGMSKDSKKAVDLWNGLVFDEKTGQIKTNAQQAVNDFAKTKDGWYQLSFETKDAKLTTNANAMIVEALAANKEWNNFSFKGQVAMIKSNSGQVIAKAVHDVGLWDALTPKEIGLIAKSDTPQKVKEAIKAVVDYNELSPLELKLMAQDLATLPTEQAHAAIQELWNNAPVEVKTLLANDDQLQWILKAAGISLDKYDVKPDPKTKMLLGDPTGVNAATKDAGNKLNIYDKNNPKPKIFNGSGNAGSVAVDYLGKIINYNNKSPKKQSFTGESSSIYSAYSKAAGYVANWNTNVNPRPKSFSGFVNIVEQTTKGVRRAKGSNGLLNSELSMVNDQRGNTFREAITLPSGKTFIPNGRNVIMPLPKGTKIMPASLTRRAYGVKQYAKGTSEYHTSNTYNEPNTSNNYSVVVNVNGGVANEIERIKKAVIDGIKKANNSKKIAFGGGGSY